MKLKIDDVRTKLADLYRVATNDDSLIAWLTELHLDYDLTGNRFSGLHEAVKFAQHGKIEIKSFTLDVDKSAMKLVNCHDTPAFVVMKDIFPQAVAWAKTSGIVFVGFHSGGYHEALGTVARLYAEQDLLCIYSSNGGPQGVVPYGGSKDIMGTNPMAYGIPTSATPVIFDAATAEYAYGTIALAKSRGETLPEKTYLNAQGEYTTDPHTAVALIPFGGYKGYAVNLLLEVMTGALVGGKSGLLQKDESDLGGFLILLDPTSFGDLAAFKAQTDQLVADIKAVPPAKGFSEVRVPGQKGQQTRQKLLAEGCIEVEEDEYRQFKQDYEKLVGKPLEMSVDHSL
jgi:ureidoglycolate dehydrogenase (NAD+)